MSDAENTTREKIAEVIRKATSDFIGKPTYVDLTTDALMRAFPVLAAAPEVANDWRLDGPIYHFWGDEDWEFVNTSLIVDSNRDAVLAPSPEGVPRTQEAYEAWQKQIETTLALIVERLGTSPVTVVPEDPKPKKRPFVEVRGIIMVDGLPYMRRATDADLKAKGEDPAQYESDPCYVVTTKAGA